MSEELEGYSSGETSSSSSCATKDSPFVVGSWTPPVRRRGGRRPVARKRVTAEAEERKALEPPVATKAPPTHDATKCEAIEDTQHVVHAAAPQPDEAAFSSPKKSPTKRKKNKFSDSKNMNSEASLGASLSAFLSSSSPRKSKSPTKKNRRESKKMSVEQGELSEELAIEQEPNMLSPKKAKKKAKAEKTPSSPTKSPTKRKKKLVDDEVATENGLEQETERHLQSPKKNAQKASIQEESKRSPKKSPRKSAVPKDETQRSPRRTSVRAEDDAKQTESPKKSPKRTSIKKAAKGHEEESAGKTCKLSPKKSPTKGGKSKKIRATPSSFWDESDTKISEYDKDESNSGVGDKLRGSHVFKPDDSVLSETLKGLHSSATSALVEISDDDDESWRGQPSNEYCTIKESNMSPRKARASRRVSRGTYPDSRASSDVQAVASSVADQPRQLNAFDSTDDDSSSSDHGRKRPQKSLQKRVMHADAVAKAVSTTNGRSETSSTSRQTKRLSAFDSTDDDDSSSSEEHDSRRYSKSTPKHEMRSTTESPVDEAPRAVSEPRNRSNPQSQKASSDRRRRLSAFDSTDDDDSSSSEDGTPKKFSASMPRQRNDDVSQSGMPSSNGRTFDTTDDDDSSSSSTNTREGKAHTKYVATQKEEQDIFSFSSDGHFSENMNSNDDQLADNQPQFKTETLVGAKVTKRRGLSAFGPDGSSSSSSDESVFPQRRTGQNSSPATTPPNTGPKPPQRSYSGGSTDSEPPFQLGLRPGGSANPYIPNPSPPSPRTTCSTDTIDSQPPQSRGVQRTISSDSTDSEPPFQLGLRPGGTANLYQGELRSSPSRTYSAESVDSEPPFSLSLRPGAPPTSFSGGSTATEGAPMAQRLRPGNISRTLSGDSTDSEPPFSLSLRPGAAQGGVPVDSSPGVPRRVPSRTYSAESTDSEPPFSLSLRPGAQGPTTTASSDVRPGIPLRALSGDSAESEGPPFPIGLRPGQPLRSYSTDSTDSDPPFCLSLRPGVSTGNNHVGPCGQGQTFGTKLRPCVANPEDRTPKPQQSPNISNTEKISGLNLRTKSNEWEHTLRRSLLTRVPSLSSKSTLSTKRHNRPLLKKVESMRIRSTELKPEDPLHVIETRRSQLRRVSSMRIRSFSRADSNPRQELKKVDSSRMSSSSPYEDPLHIIEQRRAQLKRVSSMKLPAKKMNRDDTANVILQRRAQLKRVTSLRIISASVMNTGQHQRPVMDKVSSARCLTRSPQHGFANSINADHERTGHDAIEPSDAVRRDSGAILAVSPACFDLLPTKRPPPIRTVSKTLENIMPLQDRVQTLADPQGQPGDDWDGDDLLPAVQNCGSGDSEIGHKLPEKMAQTADPGGNTCDENRQSFEFSQLRKFAESTSRANPRSKATPTEQSTLLGSYNASQSHGGSSSTFSGSKLNQNERDTVDLSQSSSKFHELRNRISQCSDTTPVTDSAHPSRRRHSSFIPKNLTDSTSGKVQGKIRENHDESMTDYSMNVEDIYEVDREPTSIKSKCHSSFAVGSTYSSKNKLSNALGKSLAQMDSGDNNESFQFAELRRIAMGAAPGYSGQQSTTFSIDSGRRSSETQLTVPPDVGSMTSLPSVPKSPKSPVKPKASNGRSVGFNVDPKNHYVTADALLSPRRFEKKKVATPFGAKMKLSPHNQKYPVESQNAKFSKSMGNFRFNDDSAGDSPDVLTNFAQQRKSVIQRAEKTGDEKKATGGIAEKLKMLNFN